MPETVNLIDQNGTTITVPVEQAASLLSRGYRQEQASDESARNVQSALEDYYGSPGGKVAAFGAGALSGATLGLSDVGLSALGGGEDLQHLQQINPYTHLAGQIGGEIASTFLPGVSEIAPAARLGRFATEAGELVQGTGALARVGRLATAGAVEGSISNAGQYLGQMAIQDKPISAEGFLASMGDGALYGGTAAGALGTAGEGLIAARRLLPATELTPLAARRAKALATEEVSKAVDESTTLLGAGQAKARRIREEAVVRNPALREELEQIAMQKARDLAQAETAAARAKTARFEADAAAAQSRAEGAAARAERVKNPLKRAKADVETLAESPMVGGDLDSELGRQLQATKQGLDAGKSLAGLSARRKETFVEDALNAHVAKVDPEMDRLLRHLDGLTDARDQVASWLDTHPSGKVKAFEYSEGMRKTSGFAEVVPQGEGNLLMPRGRQFELRGSEADRLGFESKVARGDLHRIVDDPLATAEEKLAAQHALTLTGDEQAAALADLQTKRTAKQIVGAGENADTVGLVDQHVERALNGHGELADDVEDATHAIGSLEQKTADLADELGTEAPPMAAERARGYRQAQQESERSATETTNAAIDDAEHAAKTIATGDAPRGIMGHLSKAKDLLSALELLGVPVVSHLPVVGPLLGMYLKAKLVMRAAGKLGGKIPKTAETEIARRAAETKTHLYRAVDRALEQTGRAVASRSATRAAAVTTVSVLRARLFDDRDPTTKERKPTKTDDIQDLYVARHDELMRAQDPAAVREAIRKRVRTTDAELLDELAATETRKLKFLFDKMPQVDQTASLFQKRRVKAPARADLDKWARYVGAAQRPVETMAALLDGSLVSAEATETIHTVYPRLMQDAQQRLIEKVVESPVELSFKRRNHLSTVFGLPIDDSQSPESAKFMGAQYQAMPTPSLQAMGGGIVDSRVAERVDPETKK